MSTASASAQPADPPKARLGSRAFGFMQKLGKSLMLPVAVLPVAGILLGVGMAFIKGLQQKAMDQGFCVDAVGAKVACSVQDAVGDPVAAGIVPKFVITFLQIMQDSGNPIFGALPLIFAIGVALGMTRNDGVSALAATIGYLVMNGTLGVMATSRGIETDTIMGQTTLNTGVFGGILVGIVAGSLFNRFFRISLPPYLGFFAGKRFVPIITAFASIGLGLILSFAWPPIGDLIENGANELVRTNTPVAVGLYGLVERALLPFGLHHIWNAPFFYQLNPGGWQDCEGLLTCFFKGHPDAGILGGGFLVKMFGLPGAALAIWRTAKPENRVRIGSIMVSAGLTSFLTGITEPLEFSFLFVAPLLYAVHAVLAGLAFPLMYLSGARLGYSFSQGGIDFALFFANGEKPWLVLILGPLYFLLYYVVFTFLIRRFNLRTPGREDASDEVEQTGPTSGDQFARQLVHAFGGRSNITDLDACITRLRVGVKEIGRADERKLMALGAAGVLRVGNNLQAIFGTRSENLKTDMEEYLRRAGDDAELSEAEVSDVVYESPRAEPKLLDENAPQKAQRWLEALGGAGNVVKVESAAATRLRVVVKDGDKVRSAALSDAGVSGSVRVSPDTWHLVVGNNADQYAAEIRGQMAGALSSAG
ncbi:MAG: glucose system or component [Actinomycetota bacterium]|nr:glucose system or component [Actinomycetota bacterium]